MERSIRHTAAQVLGFALVAILALLAPQKAVAKPVLVFGPDISSLGPMARPARPEAQSPGPDTIRPVARDASIPRMRWELRRDGVLWTRVTMSAIRSHGRPLLSVVPEDIAEWCPAYPAQDEEGRAQFWSGLISTLSRYESTWNPEAVGGGGLWHGLMQILPTTAQLRGCRAETGRALRDGPENLNCAVRIMAITVPRDGAVSVKGERRWQGVAADWGPIRTPWMRRDMQRYTARQTYCRLLGSVRPRPRPKDTAG